MAKIVKQKISCIVPVFNEGKRVEGVLKALIGHPLLDEVIVVNDGSSDDSEGILRKVRGINLISYARNRGKSYAVMTGMKKAKNDLLLMIDSDLVGLTAKDISALVAPVLKGKADVAMTIRKNSFDIFKKMGLDFVSGERIFSRKSIPNLNELGRLTCFGLESHLNNLIVKNAMRLAIVNWKNVITPRKSVKFGYVEGTMRDLKMVMEIVNHLGLKGIYKQVRGMQKLIVKD